MAPISCAVSLAVSPLFPLSECEEKWRQAVSVFPQDYMSLIIKEKQLSLRNGET